MKLLMGVVVLGLALPSAVSAQQGPGPGGPGGPGGFDPAAMFDRFDTNKDGKVTREEYDAVRAARAAAGGGGGGGPPPGGGAGGPPRMSWFDRMDTNKDGVVTKDEAMAAAPRPPSN